MLSEETEYVYDPDEPFEEEGYGDDRVVFTDEDGEEYVLADDDQDAWDRAWLIGIQDLENRLGRSLTQAEVNAVADRVADHESPDVAGAYLDAFAARGEPDFTNTSDRVKYANEVASSVLDYEDDDDDGEEEEIELDPDVVDLVNEVEGFQSKLGRGLTSRELNEVAGRVAAGDARTIEGAYGDYYGSEGAPKEPDVHDERSRISYAQEVADDAYHAAGGDEAEAV